jgi:hypothetical protein
MKHCYAIFKTSKNSDEKVMAVELLPYVGDRRVLGWIPEFLADSDKTIQKRKGDRHNSSNKKRFLLKPPFRCAGVAQFIKPLR